MKHLQITPIEIQIFARQGESFNIEFKQSVPSKVRELSEEICALANSQGGMVLLGISDNGQIVGCDLDNAKRSAIQNSIGEISPNVECDIYPVQVEGKSVWVIEVPLVEENKPYFVSGCVYVRRNTNSQKLTDREEIRRMFTDSVLISYDNVAVKDYDLADHIDRKTMREFRMMSGISDMVTDKQILESLSLYNREGLPINAGIMFFGDDAYKRYLHAVTRCVRFKGTDKVHIIDDKTFDGTLLEQYNDAYKWLQSNVSVSYKMHGFQPREEIWELPLEALKEALLNAICHRNYYDTGGTIMVEVYDNRITLTNPGGVLPIVQKHFGQLSMSRNPIIFNLFTRMHLVEKVGSGIPRMRAAMEKLHLSEPKIDYDDNLYSITFDIIYGINGGKEEENGGLNGGKEEETGGINNKTGGIKLNGNQQSVYSTILDVPYIRAHEIASRLNMPIRTVENIIRKLIKNNLVHHVGTRKTGGYEALQ